MYLKAFNVALSETDAKPQKPIIFHEDDILASAIKFKITNQSIPFNVTSDFKFKICMDTNIAHLEMKDKNTNAVQIFPNFTIKVVDTFCR